MSFAGYFRDRDRQNHPLNLVDLGGGFFKVDIERGRTSAGYANFRVSKGQLLHLLDLQIEDRRTIPDSPLIGLMKSLLRIPPKTESYRRLGLGTALLHWLKEHAAKHECSRIEGEIKSKDFTERPWLKDFYRKNGFEVGEGNNGSPPFPFTLNLSA